MVSPSTPSDSGPSGPGTDPASPGGALPGVVAAVVAAPSSPDLAEVMSSLATQDYPALQVVVLVTSTDDGLLLWFLVGDRVAATARFVPGI